MELRGHVSVHVTTAANPKREWRARGQPTSEWPTIWTEVPKAGSQNAVCVASVRLTDEPGASGNATAFLGANPNRVLLVDRSHGAIVTGARLEEDLESFLYTS